jgi:hypothetical protein
MSGFHSTRRISDDKIKALVAERTLAQPALDMSPYVNRIVHIYGEKILGIYMYGSMLSEVTKSTTSFPDFFVVTDGYHKVFQKLSHRILAYPLPPHIFHLRLNETERCKYNLLALHRFQRETSTRAADVYIFGRFGKRVSLVYSRDQQAQKDLVDCCVSAMRTVALWSARGMGFEPFDEKQFTLACLNLSYAGETRVEATSKVPKLFTSEQNFYMQVYPALLREFSETTHWVRQRADGRYELSGNSIARWVRSKRFQWFLKRSRIRGILRWPKFLVTVDEWVDIILAKIERTKGIKLDPTPAARRHPLIFGWPYLFRLIRAKAIGSSKTIPEKDS